MTKAASFNATPCQIRLRDGRILSYAEFGLPSGRPVFFFTGLPGSRLLRHPDDSIANKCNARLIAPDRPGMGFSDFQPGRRLLDWPADIVDLADALKIDRFAVAGFSGGGPYVAACAFKIPHRLIASGLVSGVGPLEAPDALEGMLSSNRMGYWAGQRTPWFLWRLIFHLYYRDISRHPEKLAQISKGEPESDRAIFAQPGVRDVFIQNFAEAFRQGTQGAALDGWLLSRPWGFRLEEITMPVYLWQGEADVVVTPAMGRYMVSKIPNCHARFLPGEGHLIIFKFWKEILEDLLS